MVREEFTSRPIRLRASHNKILANAFAMYSFPLVETWQKSM